MIRWICVFFSRIEQLYMFIILIKCKNIEIMLKYRILHCIMKLEIITNMEFDNLIRLYTKSLFLV